jgi:hypothetical protein
MPFVSQAQRGLFYKAESDPAFAKSKGLSKGVIRKFIAHDKPGKLPQHKKPEKEYRFGSLAP